MDGRVMNEAMTAREDEGMKGEPERKTGRQTKRETERDRRRQTERDTNRQTYWHTDSDICIYNLYAERESMQSPIEETWTQQQQRPAISGHYRSSSTQHQLVSHWDHFTTIYLEYGFLGPIGIIQKTTILVLEVIIALVMMMMMMTTTMMLMMLLMMMTMTIVVEL